jgi:cytochrome c oxidase assembly protein subunit 11
MTPAPAPNSKQRSRAGLTAALCAIFVAGMVGMAFAAVPLYKIFCQVTGYGGTTQRAERAPGEELARLVTVRFDANIGNDLGWGFRPAAREMKVRVGQVAEAAFLVENRGGRTTTGLASFNVSPGEAGLYFNKIACFCFTAQTLAAGEERKLNVQFFVDPSIAKDHELDGVDTITLSYAFYPAPADAVLAKPVAAVPAKTSESAL